MVPLLFILALLVAVVAGFKVLYWGFRLVLNVFLLLAALCGLAAEVAVDRREERW